MTRLSDRALAHLREVADRPDTSGTKYDIIEPIGRGGMGTVYRARDRELDRDVAFKVLRDPAPGGDGAARMLREARVLARLEHPGLVPVHDVGTLPDGRPYYVMKLVRGEPLDAYVRAARTSLEERLRILQRLCEAVAFAHAHGVIHRDLKPQNVMIGRFGEVLVMDWGVAKVAGAPPDDGACSTAPPTPGDTAPGTVLGTPGYMPPEQAAGGAADVDERADVFALGAVLGFLLDAPRDIAGAIPPALRAIRARATAPAREDRYPSADGLAADVARFLDRLPVSVHREGALERVARVAGKYRGALVLVAAYLLMRALLLAFGGR
ncbi:MAG TPA: serine/threonine-protein kinase [Gemmatimonadaceae bacterium]|nr:serine/threonine-protein kinase [Gemmatimonadaceae bacterium]